MPYTPSSYKVNMHLLASCGWDLNTFDQPICLFPILPPFVIAVFFLCWVLVTHTIFSQSLWQYFFSSKNLNPYLHDNLCFTRQLSLICLLCISHEPMSLYTALCSTLLLRLFQDPDNVFRIFNQVYSGSKTLHISTCQIYNYVVLLVSINLDYMYPSK